MRFKGLDLNLLYPLRVLLEEANVSRAAQRTNMSQPAMSGALARLREYYGDDLLVQVGRKMVPTAFAEELRPLLDAFLQSAESVRSQSDNFDPTSSTRRFRISVSDYMMTILVGPLVRELSDQAPGVSLDFVPPGPQASEALEKGDLDLKIDPEEYLSSQHPAQLLLEDEHVVVGCRDNPALARPLDLAAMEELKYVAIRFGGGRQLSFAERHLPGVLSSQRIEVTTPSFSSVPGLVIGTHRVAVLQKRLVHELMSARPIAILPLPMPFPPLRMMVQYHSARVRDEGLLWLVQQLKLVADRGITLPD